MIELPAMIDDELAVKHDTGNIKYDKKGQEQNALENVHLGNTTKVSAEPESAIIPGVENGKNNRVINHRALKYTPCAKENQRKIV